MHVERSMIPHSSAAAAAAAARKKGRKCLFPACPPASYSKERERIASTPFQNHKCT